MNLDLLELLYDARRAAVGIIVKTSDPERLRQKLYAARKNDPDLASLAFVISPANGIDLWIINKETPDAEG